MGNKEGLDLHVEDFLNLHRKVRERRETTEYDVIVSRERAAFLRDALAQRREDTMILVAGDYYSGMMAAPSSVENKLSLAISLSQELKSESPEEILVHLQASDIDELNASLFPTINIQDERSMATLETIIAVNNAYTGAGGIERPSFVDGIKLYQV